MHQQQTRRWEDFGAGLVGNQTTATPCIQEFLKFLLVRGNSREEESRECAQDPDEGRGAVATDDSEVCGFEGF